MAQVCDICGKGPQFGNNISHAHNVTKRRWNVNSAGSEGAGEWRAEAVAGLRKLHQERQDHQSWPDCEEGRRARSVRQAGRLRRTEIGSTKPRPRGRGFVVSGSLLVMRFATGWALADKWQKLRSCSKICTTPKNYEFRPRTVWVRPADRWISGCRNTVRIVIAG